MRTRAVLVVLAVVAVVALAGCTLSAFDGTSTAENDSASAPAPAENGTLADPEEDVEGWENGVWYNESLPVNASDGLNESELALVVNRSMARVERVRNVEFDRRVPVSVISREEYADRQSGSGGGGETAATREAVRLEALFLVGERTDAQAEQERTRSASVQGFYSSSEDEITIVAPTSTPTVDEVTLAHELVHAYQFRGNIDVRFPRSPTRDERRALVALIEGDANLVDRTVRSHCDGAWSCVGHDAGSGGGDGAGDGGGGSDGGDGDGGGGDEGSVSAPRPNMGLYLLSYFPYAEGERYVAATKRAGGWEAVNALYADPPSSSEQVIHRTDDAAVDVSVPDRSDGAWTRLGDDPVVSGEADLATMFAATLYDDREGSVVSREAFLTRDDPIPITYGLEPSAGWAGDGLYAYQRDDGDTGYVWRLRFDDDAEAREFASSYRELLRYHDADRPSAGVFVVEDGPYADAFSVSVSGGRVTIVNAPTVDDLGGVHEPAGQRVAPAGHRAQLASDAVAMRGNATGLVTAPPRRGSA
ncbi:hypothetical protein G9C85_11120 [Halorubellus sp. JP-L1]|uniref:Hvo_1808 family surface protein n=1 Tax=Halorubellus sp. JP-L1 TaxID=2715753 RepID=UPI0014079FAE|nr:Hvo_1808 family surface protein [Halorubellus sp. JP-L1]NHN42172.1 hypothetical protein [Halorubellus sp. JP-L1]